jgi:general secretion pathway protein J
MAIVFAAAGLPGPPPRRSGFSVRFSGDSPGHGFTLFELILSLTILAVLLLLIFGALRLGARAWDRGERDLTLDQQERIVLDMVRHQTASWTVFNQDPQEGQEPLPVQGGPGEFSFFSSAALLPGGGFTPVYVKYAVVQEEDDTQALYLFEESTALSTVEALRTRSGDLTAFYPLVRGMEKISLDYLVLDPAQDVLQWQESWDQGATDASAGGTPVAAGATAGTGTGEGTEAGGETVLKAVRIRFWDSRRDHPLSVVARMHEERHGN